MTPADLEMVLSDNYCQLYNRAYRICRNTYDAEDAVQNACLKAWSRLPYTAVNVCEAWLHVIVYHECIMILRNKSRFRLSFDAEMICFLRDTEDWIEEYLDKQRFIDMIESLPVQYASLIKLRYYDRMGIKEIADQLHQSTGTIRSRLFRARQMLRTRYCERL